MALSSYPSPSDCGVLCLILSNTVMSIAMVKEIALSLLHALGIHITSWEEFSVEPTDSNECRKSPTESYMDDLRSLIQAKQYECECPTKRECCSICLAEFYPKAEVNILPCSHVFHISCLEKWLERWNSTCPLCRNHMTISDTDEDNACPM